MRNEVIHKIDVDVIEWSFKDLKPGESISIPGFKVQWLTFGNDDIEATLYSGAGCGNKWLECGVEKGGETRHFKIDASKLAEAILGIVEPEEVGFAEDVHNW